jgi:hypothetical protein
MKRIAGLVLVAVLCFAVLAMAEAPKFKYVGAAKCKVCHGAMTGDQFKVWSGSAHAKAIATLSTDAAKKIGAAKNIADPSKAPECLKCHLTGYGKATECFENPITDEGVGCEVCHGPGSAYKAMAIMKDPVKAKENGLILPTDKKFCAEQCHNAGSPTFKEFKLDEMWAKIAHPLKKK